MSGVHCPDARQTGRCGTPLASAPLCVLCRGRARRRQCAGLTAHRRLGSHAPLPVARSPCARTPSLCSR
eukprot:250176-Pleurochrysis_carterae.AAC.1